MGAGPQAWPTADPGRITTAGANVCSFLSGNHSDRCGVGQDPGHYTIPRRLGQGPGAQVLLPRHIGVASSLAPTAAPPPAPARCPNLTSSRISRLSLSSSLRTASMLSPSLLWLAIAVLPAWLGWRLLSPLYSSPLQSLRGPPAPSLFLGNFRQISTVRNSALMQRWIALYGPSFLIRWFGMVSGVPPVS